LDILEPLLPEVTEKGAYIRTEMEKMNLPVVAGTRGRGLMIGVEIKNAAPRDINAKLLEAGLVALTAGADAVRFLPPLVIGYNDIDAGLAIIKKVMT
jgi:acetylornithine/succinyldiaminopimelate/putrescine aminotransferase